MPKETLFVYLTHEGILSSVFDSQVLAYIVKLQRNLDIDLIAFDGRKSTKSVGYREKAAEVRPKIEGQVFLLSQLPFLGRLTLFAESLNLAMLYRKHYKHIPTVLFHARGQLSAFLALQLKKAFPKTNIKVIADFRGLIADEIRYPLAGMKTFRRFLQEFRAREVEAIERAVCQGADSILCVSDAFKHFLAEKYKIDPSRITVVPCCVDRDLFKYNPRLRKRFRAELNLNDRFVVVFSGSMDRWQKPEALARAFLQVKSQQPDAFFLILTNQLDEAKSALQAAGVPEGDYRLMSVPHKELSGYLTAADLGLLLREDIPLNRVACPVKFAEYLASGVPVLVSPCIGDLGRIVRDFAVGVIYKDSQTNWETLASIRADRQAWGERCITASSNLFNLDSHIQTIERLYRGTI